jgi:arylsulfatase A-like enzyme
MRCRLGSSLLSALLLIAASAGGAGAACSTVAEATALKTSLADHLQCARLRLEYGTAVPCTPAAPPACAGAAPAALVDLLLGDGPPAAPPGSTALKQLRCQRAILGAAKRYAGKRVSELVRGGRQARRARVFTSVRTACDGVTVLDVQGTALPSLGDPCRASTAGTAGPLDGERIARCSRAGLERLLVEMTVGTVRPNVVLVMTDDQNLASVPWMARVSSLRRRGLDFKNAFVTTPVCAPSRASLFTGRYAHRHGLVSNFLAAPSFDASSTFATSAQAAGYRTALIGKYMNYAGSLTAVPPGWDEWQALVLEEVAGNEGYVHYALDVNGTEVQAGTSPREYSTDLLAARSIAFLRGNAAQPFVLVFTPYAPHVPAIPAARHAGYLQFIQPWRPPNWHEPDVSAKPNWVKFMKSTNTPEDTAETDAERTAQLETLLAVDEAVGRIEDTLESLGLTDNTLLVFTSDHGYHWGEHWWTSKFTAYEESIRVPLVMSYPVLAPEPAERSELVLNIDLAPTIAELVGGTAPAQSDGVSLVPLLAAPGPVRQDFFIQSFGALIAAPFEGVRDVRFKYVKTAAQGGVTEELYDLDADPHELVNVAAEPAFAPTLQQLRERMIVLRDG